jgi:signal transduction histidine kinase
MPTSPGAPRATAAASDPPSRSAPRHGAFVPLAVRLAGALVLLAAALAVLLLLWLAPRTASALRALGDDFVRDGSAAMQEVSLEQSMQTSDLLIDLLQSSVTDRERALRELPLESLAGDANAVRRAIADDDARRHQHERQRVVTATNASLARSEGSIATRLRALTAAQVARTDELVRELRGLHLTLVVAAFALSLAVLGLGLRQQVIVPLRRLRAATRRVAAGDLELPAPPPAARDELGELAHDFAAMVAQLHDARDAQRQLAASLADQVADKTAHLERALAELRSSHAQLAQAERLAALGTLAGGVAHEFHNVIGGIRGCAAELAATARDADARETLAVIQRAADRGSAIVQQLLRFARRSVERAAEVDVEALATEALQLCEPAARRQHVRVERSLTPGLRVRGDADGLHQVLVNLLVNALQAMPSGGTLAVRTFAHGDEVRVEIADTGTGIAAEHLPHVFEPFFTTKRGDGGAPAGSGLGLSVSWGVVAAHGGRIEVRSEAGAGSTFTVCLPAAGAQPA